MHAIEASPHPLTLPSFWLFVSLVLWVLLSLLLLIADIVSPQVETTVENVDAGHNRLVRTLNDLTSGRGLTLKLSGVAAAFVVFFVVFLA